MVDKRTSKANELRKLAAAKREEAGSRRGLARLVSSTASQFDELRQQALELETQAAAMEREATRLMFAKPGKQTPRRRPGERG